MLFLSTPLLILLAVLTKADSIANSSTSASNASTSIPAEYTITALPQVTSQPACVFNCLIPIGLADPSGCDDVTEDCACLSAPADVLDVLTDCIQVVCPTSTDAYAAIATSLYESYCNSVYGAAAISSAFSAESQADASASVASVLSASLANATMSLANATMSLANATMTSSGASATGGVTTSSGGAATAASSATSAVASATAKSESVWRSPSLVTVGLALGGILILVAL